MATIPAWITRIEKKDEQNTALAIWLEYRVAIDATKEKRFASHASVEESYERAVKSLKAACWKRNTSPLWLPP